MDNRLIENLEKLKKMLVLLSEERIEAFHQKQRKKQKVLVSLRGNSINLTGKKVTLYDLCKRNDFSEQDVFKLNPDNTSEFTAVYYDAKYSGYVTDNFIRPGGRNQRFGSRCGQFYDQTLQSRYFDFTH
jgi:tRNA U34 5-carboxymethylaminomethyl modifying enzyme MnmG/GidA